MYPARLALGVVLVMAALIVGSPTAAAADCRATVFFRQYNLGLTVECRGSECEAWVESQPPWVGCSPFPREVP